MTDRSPCWQSRPAPRTCPDTTGCDAHEARRDGVRRAPASPPAVLRLRRRKRTALRRTRIAEETDAWNRA
ncbi:MAG: hypothetical protein MZV70_72140 [Desulfobacterales bacterium]|nr:hypothetical protein [Desulfobacterales bacterium]